MFMNGMKNLYRLKKNIMITLIKNSLDVKKAFGITIKAFLLISLVLITCTCSGLKLMLGTQTFGNQIDYSTYFGKHANLIVDPTECVILRTDGPGLVSWLHPTQLTRQQYREILGLEYSLSRELTLRRCSQIRLYPYQLTTHSFLNRYKTGWNVPKQNYRIKSHLNVSRATRSKRQTKIYKRDWIRPSTGRIPETTRTTERNSNYSSTMNRVNGRDRTTSSTTGGSRKQR